MPHTEQLLKQQTIFEGKIITLTLDEVRLENGETARREVVHHGGGAGVVALRKGGEVALVRQYRHAAGREMVEIPAGKIEAGEEPIATARRELGEEAGLAAAHLVPFGKIIPTCAFCTEVIHIFLATGLSPVARNLDEDEFVDLFWLPLAEAVQMVNSGEIIDAKTVSGLLRAKALLDAGSLAL